MEMKGYDFSGWATKNDLKCTDGRTIRRGAFKQNNGKKVPLVWNHFHHSVDGVLGHAILENRDEGVYAYGFFNNTENGRKAKEMVHNGDITSLSIYANKLQQSNERDVLHGDIQEVSLVLAGANPGATIDMVLSHGEEMEDECVICIGDESFLIHSEEEPDDREIKKANFEPIESTEEEEEEEKKRKKTWKLSMLIIPQMKQ